MRTLKAMAIFFAVSILVTAFAYRPATVLGVDGDALAHSGCIDITDVLSLL